MVVALHLEHDREPVADIDDAGVLARPLDHPGRLGRQRAQMDPRRLVRAVLVPHGREDAELGEGRRAADQLQDALVFVGLQAVRGDQGGRDFCSLGGFRFVAPSSWARLGGLHEVLRLGCLLGTLAAALLPVSWQPCCPPGAAVWPFERFGFATFGPSVFADVLAIGLRCHCRPAAAIHHDNSSTASCAMGKRSDAR